MIVFPAIDLVAGKVVRLERGDRSRMKVYSENPAAVARDFVEQGATWLHVVDLSAAFEEDEAAREANLKAIAVLMPGRGNFNRRGRWRAFARKNRTSWRVWAPSASPWAPCSCVTSRSPRQRRPFRGAARGRCGRQRPAR